MRKYLLTSILIVLIPFFVTKIFVRSEKLNLKLERKNIVMIKVKNEKTNEILTIPIEKYLVGVVSGEMPINFENEALKAQTVASRSYAMYHIRGKEYDVTNTTSTQVYLDEDELRKKWGEKYDENFEKVKKIVDETKGEYLTYNGEIVNAMFFSTSVGATENSEDVFTTKIPYLRSVSSQWDKSSPVFTDVMVIDIKDFYKKLEIEYNEKLEIEVVERTGTGRTKIIKINGKEINGREFASKLKIRSNYFDINQKENSVIITTKGYGHGVGMSQYGANGMAKEGYKYREILKHYYEGTEIKKT